MNDFAVSFLPNGDAFIRIDIKEVMPPNININSPSYNTNADRFDNMGYNENFFAGQQNDIANLAHEAQQAAQQVGSGGGETQQGGSDGGETQQGGSDVNYIDNGNGSFSVTIKAADFQLIANNINGNPLENNPEIVSTVDKMNYTKIIVGEAIKEEVLKAFNNDEVLRDLLENGVESEYLEPFNAATREYLSDFFKTLNDVHKNEAFYGGKLNDLGNFLVNLVKYPDRLLDQHLPTTDRLAYQKAMEDYHYRKNLSFMASPFPIGVKLDTLLDYSDEPDIKSFKQSGNDKLKKIRESNLSFWNKFKKEIEWTDSIGKNKIIKNISGVLGKFGMGLGVFSLLIDLNDNQGNISKALQLVSDEKGWDKWVAFNAELEALDQEKYDQFVLDLFNTAPVMPLGLNTWAKTAYLMSKHPDADFWKTFGRQFNPLDINTDNYVPESVDYWKAFAEPWTNFGKTLAKSWENFVEKFNPFDASKGNYVPNINDPETNTITLIGGIGITNRIINNNTNNVVIQGGNKGNVMENYASDNVTLYGGIEYNVMINLNGNNVLMSGDAGSNGSNFVYNVESDDATIYIDGAKSTVNNFHSFRTTITAGKGNDQIDNFGSFNKINAGGGNNVINTIGLRVSITAGDGDDIIDTTGDSVEINSGAGDDYIVNEAGNLATIDSGDGNDSISNDENSANVSINAGDGDDYIENFGDRNTINAGDGSDVVNNVGNGNSVYADFGDDYIENFGQSNTVVGATGEDYILNAGDSNLVDAGADDDYIENIGNDNTILAGSGNDIIDLRSGTGNVINYTKGNDYIYGFGESSTLQISGGKGTYSVTNSNENIIVAVGEYKVTLEKALRLSVVNIDGINMNPSILSEGDDTYSNVIGNATIYALGGNDSIENSASFVTILGGADNDTINGGNIVFSDVVNINGENFTVHSKGGKHVFIDGGNGDDYIRNDLYVWNEESQTYVRSKESHFSTLNGGAGNDTIEHLHGNNVSITGGTGDDYIRSFRSDDATISGGDDNDTIENDGSNVLISGDEGNDSIDNAGDGALIDGGDGNDHIYNGGNNSTLFGGAGDDTITNGDVVNNSGSRVTIDAGEGNNKISNLASKVSIKASSGNDFINNKWGKWVTVDSGTGADTISSTGENISINSGKGDDSILAGSSKKITIDAGDGNDTIIIDSASLNNADGEPQYYNIVSDSTIRGGQGNDYVENRGGENLTFIYNEGDGNDTIEGFNETSTLQIGDGNGTCLSQISGTDILVNVGNGSVLLKNAASLGSVNINGISSLITGTNDADSINNSLSGALIKGLNGDDYISNSGDKVIINDYEGNNKIINSGVLVSMISGNGADAIGNAGNAALINAGNGNNSIGNAGDKVSIFAGNGNDLIINEGNNVTVTVAGGINEITNKGSATSIVVGSGNNIIQNYGTDVIVTGGTSNDLIMNGNSTVTLNGNKGNDVFVNYFVVQVDDNYNVTALLYYGNNVLINGDDDNDYIENEGGKATLNGGAGNDTLINNGIFIADKNSSLLGYYATDNGYLLDGGQGNDYVYNMNSNATIYGGVGNDTIELDSNAENNIIKYKFEDGNDIIYGCNNTTTIKISGYDPEITQNGNDIIVKIAESTMTLKDAASVSGLTILREDDKFIKGTEGADIINNNLESATINALGGNDSISNGGDNVKIDSGANDDTISNSGSNVTIDAGAGDDSIANGGDNVTIDGDSDDDEIYNSGSSVIIDAGSGDDSIANGGDNVLIIGGSYDDSIVNEGNNVTINGDSGDDEIYNSGSNVLIDGSIGDDYIDNSGDKVFDNGGNNVTINGGTGNDTIYNDGSNITINGDLGNDTIYSSGSSVLIDGGDSDDYLYSNGGANVTIKGGEGADSITNRSWRSNATIDGGASNDTIENYGKNSTVDGGKDDDYVTNWGESSTLIGGDGADSIVNQANNVLISGGNGNDFIGNGTDGKYSYGARNNVTIDAGEGDDTIKNSGSNVSINAGTGNDNIANYLYYGVTINAGADNDTVTNSGSNVSIDAGNGDDYISNSGSYVTIKGGKGNDTLDGVGSETILFGTGDGSDIINNYKNKNLIKLTSGKILTTLLSGEDIILSLGSDSLTLKNAKYKLVRIDNVDGTQTIINEERIGQTISNALSNQTLAGGPGNDSIYNTGNNVTINSGEGDDSITNRGASVLIDGHADNNFIKNNKFIEWNDNAYQWVTSSISPDNVTILGGEDGDRILNYGGQRISIDGGNGDDYISNETEPEVYKSERIDHDYEEVVYPAPDYATLLGGDGNDTIENSGANSIIDGGNGNDDIENFGNYSTINAGIGDDKIYNGKGNNALINGDEGSDYIRNSGNNSTVNGGQGSDSIENNSNNLFPASPNVLINGDEGDDFLRNRISLNISINGGSGNDTIENYGGTNALLNGGDGDDLISNKTGYSAYNTILSDNVTIDAGAGNDTIINEGTNVLFIYSGGNDSIVGFNETSSLQIGNGKTDIYSKETVGDDILVSVGSEVITLSGATSLSNINILGDEKPHWSFNGAIAKCGNLFTISNVKNTDSIVVNQSNKTVTLKADNLTGNNVSITGDYSLVLNGINPSTSTAAHFDGLTYKSASSSEGYSLSNDKKNISYIPAVIETDLFSLTNVKNTDSITVNQSNKTVILSSNNLTGKNVSVIGYGYTLALDGVAAPTTVAAQWHGTTYKSEYISAAGYEVGGNKITYTAATNPIELFSLNGIDSADGFEVSKNGDNYIVNISNLSYDASKTITLNKKSSNVRFAYADNFAGNKVQTIAQAASLNNGTYTSTTYQPWSDLDDDALTIYPATAAKTFTISGLGNGAKLGTNVVISENKVTISDGALNNTHEKISVSDPSYTLEVTASPVKAINFAQNGNKVTLSGTTAGYKKVNGEYVWQEQIGGESLTITGLKSDAALTANMFTRSGNVITFKPTQDLLPDNPTAITISSGVIDTSALSTTGAVDAHWSGTTYVSAKTASSWTTGTSSVSYTPAAGGEELFTIDGVKSVNGITPTQNGKSYKVTLPATAFDKSGTITVTKKNAAATLEFEGIGTTIEPVDATLTKDGVYKTAHTPEYFATSTSGDTTTYTYTAAKNDCGFTISGLNLSNDISGTAIDEYFTFNNGTVTVKKLGTNNITLNNIDADGDNDGIADIKIKLALDENVVQAANTLNTSVALIKGGNNYVYTSAGYKPWYELSDTKITYHPATGGETLFTISGLGTATLGENIIVDGTTVKVSDSALAQKNVSITGDYTLTLNNVSAPLPIPAHFDGLTYKGTSNTAGYTIADNGKLISYKAAGVASDLFTLTGIKTTDGITVDGNVVTLKEDNLNGEDVTITGNDYKLNLSNDVTKPSTTAAGWSLSDTTAIYKNAATSSGYKLADNKISYVKASGGETLATVTGVKSLDGVSLNGNVVTVSNAALNGKDVTITGNGYTLALGSDVATPIKTNAGWDPVSSGKAVYNFESTTAGYTLTDNKINYIKATPAKTFMLSGIKSTNGINISGTTVTLNASNLDKKTVAISDGYTLALNNDVTLSKTITAGWSGSNGTFTHTEAGSTEGYKIDGKTITYNEQIGGEQFTLTGVRSTDDIKVEGNVITIGKDSLNGENVTISDGYTLALSSDVAESSTTVAKWTNSGSSYTYTAAGTSAGYKLSSNKISYTPAIGGEQFSITGVKDTNSITVSGNKVTIGKNSLNGKAVTLTGDYTLALGSDVPTSAKQTVGTFTSFSNGTAKFKSNSFSDFYKLSGKTISYTPAASSKDITLTGLKKTLTLKNGTISGITSSYSNGVTTFKIKAEDLTTGNVVLTGDGKLQLDGYKKPANVAATFVKGVYTQAYTPAFYTVTDKKITYTAKNGGDKFTITGLKSSATPLKSNTGIKVDSKGVVTLSSSALDGKAVTLVNDTKDGVNKIAYKLAVDSSVSTKATTTKAAWTKKNSTFTYTAPITSDFYTIKGNTLNYTAKKGGEQFTITGLKNTNAVTVSGKKVTIGNNSLDGKAVTLTDDYTLALAKDVMTSAKKTAGAFTTVSKGTATYKTTSFGGYYKVSGKKISFTAGSGGQSITIKNLNIATKLSALKSGVTVAEQSNGSYKITFKNSAVLTTKAPTVSAAKGLKYTVAVADSLKPITKSAWTVSGTTATFRATTTAGYTVNSKNAVVYTAQKNGSPLLELNGLIKNVKASSIAAPKGKVVTLNATVLGAKTSVKSNGGNYTINLSGNMSGKKFTGTGKVDTLTVAANNANVDLGAGNDVVTVSGLKVTLNGGAGNDTLSGGKDVDWIYGDAGNDSLRGGAGNDTLTGGKGDDQLWGDAGKDTFLFSNGDGKDVIYGFETGDLLQITGTFSASYNKSQKEIAFKVGSTANAITLKDFTATSFHINGDTYGISGTKLVKK